MITMRCQSFKSDNVRVILGSQLILIILILLQGKKVSDGILLSPTAKCK